MTTPRPRSPIARGTRMPCPGAGTPSTAPAGDRDRCGTCYAQVTVKRDGTLSAHTAHPRRVAGALAQQAQR